MLCFMLCLRAEGQFAIEREILPLMVITESQDVRMIVTLWCVMKLAFFAQENISSIFPTTKEYEISSCAIMAMRKG